MKLGTGLSISSPSQPQGEVGGGGGGGPSGPITYGTPSASDDGSFNTTHVVSKPSGLEDGDTLLIFALTGYPGSGTFNTPTPPEGFGILRETTNTYARLVIMYKQVADAAAEPSTYTVTWAEATYGVWGAIPVHNADPELGAAWLLDDNLNTGTDHTAPSVETEGPGLLLTAFFHTVVNQNISPPSGMIEVFDVCNGGSGVEQVSLEVAALAIEEAGITGTKTVSGYGSSRPGAGVTVFIPQN